MERCAKLDEIRNSHSAVGGTKRGRRFATLQINHAYAVMLCSQFQGFCRDLHDESIGHAISGLAPAAFRTVMAQALARDRRLDRGNANSGNLGSDFNRFGIQFWSLVDAADSRCSRWRSRLEILTDWRNAIAHQDFDPDRLHGIATLALRDVEHWRRACHGLARVFDRVMGTYCVPSLGVVPGERR